MNRDKLEKLISQARASGETPKLQKIQIGSIDLSGIDLSGVDLTQALLAGAKLNRANFTGAILSFADLSLADLTDANFSGANLSNADLRFATIANTNFHNAVLAGVKGLSREQIAATKLVLPRENDEEPLPSVTSGIIIPLQFSDSNTKNSTSSELPPPTLPARWEAAKSVAEEKNVLPALLHQIRRVAARDFLEYLIGLAQDEGYVWVVYGASGSGKSSFFHTLEHQTDGAVKVHVIDGNSIDLTDQTGFAAYLTNVIVKHKDINGRTAPLVLVLEERETTMSTDERSAICQALRNVLRSPKHGNHVIFVLPVTEDGQGSLFLEQVRNTGVSVPLGQNQIYSFQGPTHNEHVDILASQFIVFNDKDIKEYGLYRSDLQKFVSSGQTIGQYIRAIREELAKQNDNFRRTIRSHSYRPCTVVICFVNPLPGYRTEPTIKAMTINAFNRIKTSEILRTQSQKAQRWQGKHQALANIIEALDVRIVEITPQLITRLLYAYGGERTLGQQYNSTVRSMIEDYLAQEKIEYHAHKSVRSGLSKQLSATNLLKIIAGEETEPYPTPRYLNKKELTAEENERKNREHAEISISKLVCESSNANQHELHTMFSLAIQNVLQNSTNSGVVGFKSVYPEAWLTLPDRLGNPEKKIRPDIVVEMQDKLFLLEFCWRSDEHFTYADISSYVLRKITESYANLPLIRALSEGALDI